MKKVELLAPAGSYEAFLGAVHAGADAVYLGGQRFGARAYAENFSKEDILRALRYAHLYERKVYLTVNTLIKDKEMEELYEYLAPFYQAGLDGVILQDMGALSYIREHFPGLALHASTQMTITGVYGARLLKELGVCRIVPARELSLEEIKQIRKEADIETEVFIHGAMCYCYSGQCLFSSLLGGRSGNRGRCAQPCRLPYRTTLDNGASSAKIPYPLSLKDMCTIQILPALIEAGIDSFKIEGRMKKPEYAAGVTALYRACLDKYYANPDGEYKVEEKDLIQLQTLYMRSGLQSGYYDRHNGADMITPHKPSYAGCDETLLKQIRQTYIDQRPSLTISGVVTLKEGLPAQLTVRRHSIEVCAAGSVVERAARQPLTAEGVAKQLQKTGNTPFAFSELKVVMDDAVFIPLKTLNELRREALEQLEEALQADKNRQSACPGLRAFDTNLLCEKNVRSNEDKNEVKNQRHTTLLTAEVTAKEQLQAVYASKMADRIYIPSDLLLEKPLQELIFARHARQKDRPALYAALPHIVRERSARHLRQLEAVLQAEEIEGALVRNLEALEWLRETGWRKAVVTDANLYVWNAKSRRFFAEMGAETTAPVELNERELRSLNLNGMEMIVYGRLPMMITANCIRKTNGRCAISQEPVKSGALTDRYHKTFDVITWCGHCYNIIYNSVPLSLHQFLPKLQHAGLGGMRLSFTTETAAETERVIAYFYQRINGQAEATLPYEEYTNGHYKRGVE